MKTAKCSTFTGIPAGIWNKSTGEASTNILRMAREGLRLPLSAAIRSANTYKKTHIVEGVSVQHEGRRSSSASQ
ncbi:MAG: hypothetical protein R2856_07175 [Caldilineaceae bacterium]